MLSRNKVNDNQFFILVQTVFEFDTPVLMLDKSGLRVLSLTGLSTAITLQDFRNNNHQAYIKIGSLTWQKQQGMPKNDLRKNIYITSLRIQL